MMETKRIIRFISQTCILLLLMNIKIYSQEKLDIIKDWIHFSDAPNSLYHHIADQAYEQLDKRTETISEIKDLSVWQERQKWIRETLKDMVGPFPDKTPLNAKILKKIYKTDYVVEHIVFESQPEFYVTSSLFIPTGREKGSKFPAVIYCSGHSADGYHGFYQQMILNLVKKGFIVFAFDPISQGERIEYYDPNTNSSKIGGPVSGHSYPGAQALLIGSSQSRFMIWDGIRALDYLLTREEVDPERIGITGRSGGGTQSAQIAALDDRIYAAAPESYITNFTRLFQYPGPQDAEQNLYNSIERGIDHADLLLVRAPKPTLILATTGDYFSIQGFKETAVEVKRIYQAYGSADNFSTAVDVLPRHGSTKKNREAMYAFFQKYLNNPGSSVDEEVDFLTEDEIQVTSTGQVSTSLGGETIFSMIKAQTLVRIDKLDASRNDLKNHLAKVLATAKELSGYRDPNEIKKPVFNGTIQRKEYNIHKYFIRGEGNYVIPYFLIIPDNANNKALLYLNPSGKKAEVDVGGEIEYFVKKGFTVLAPDLIGTGETGPGDFKGDSYIQGVSYNLWFASMLIGRSILGIRAGDVARLTRMLLEDENINEVYGLAKKEMTPVLLHAAAFEPGISRIALLEPYSSYRSILMNKYYNVNFVHSFVPGALVSYDLPDLSSALAPRKLLIVGTTDGNGLRNDTMTINKDLEIIEQAYHFVSKPEQLEIKTFECLGKQDELFSDWLK